MTDGANASQVLYWNEIAGAKWVANQHKLDRLMAPLSDALIATASAMPGEAVLDIGTGCGDVALRIADLIGAQGRVLAVDISVPMLAHAAIRYHALPAGPRAPIAWRHADAMLEAFEPTNDLLVSRFGVMFFDNVPRAFANLRRALRPGGRFAFLAWRRRAEIEWMQGPLDWIASVVPIAEDVPGEIGPFALADPDATCRLLTNVGFSDVSATPLDRSLTIGQAPSDAADPNQTAVEDALVVLADTGPAARQLRDAEPDLRERALGCIRTEVARRVRNGKVALDGACWIYRGRA